MNRGGSQHRNQQSNRNLAANSNRIQNPQALHGVNNRHAPSAGEARNGRNILRNGEGAGLVNLDNFTTSQRNINNAILEYLQKQGYNRTSDQLNEDISQHLNGQLQRSFSQDATASI